MWSPGSDRCGSPKGQTDGVLNVGLSQGENNTLMLSLRNMALARRVQLDIRASKSSKDAAESLFNLASAPLSGEVGTLQKLGPERGREMAMFDGDDVADYLSIYCSKNKYMQSAEGAGELVMC
eukprot:Skav222862  [mRNA]  locus=scaffold2201:167311:170194:- [translate_table: standard]